MSKCRLKEMWRKQAEQQAGFNMDPQAMTDIARTIASKDLCLGVYEEVTELAGYIASYKEHLLKAARIEKVNVADCVVDVIKYALAAGQLYGVTDDDIYESFLRKSEVVRDRARGERLELESNTPVLVVDVDNVIADLTDWDKNLRKARGDSEGMNEKVVDVLESMKDTFYKEGGFTKLKPIPGAVEGVRELRGYGWKIVLISARPYWQYKRIHADTVLWLREIGLEYDLLMFNKDKAEAIYEFIFPARPSYLVEDREKHVLEVSELGIRVLLLDYPYNEGVKDTELITRVRGWDEIVKIIGKPERA